MSMLYIKNLRCPDSDFEDLMYSSIYNPFWVIRNHFEQATCLPNGKPVLMTVAIQNTTFTDINHNCLNILFENVEFINCTFVRCDFTNSTFSNCSFTQCKQVGCIRGDKIHAIEIPQKDVLIKETTKEKLMTNEEIEKIFGCKCKTLQNKEFVKCIFTCDFCHKEIIRIFRRNDITDQLNIVPNCDKKVCRECFTTYRLTDKFYGHRHYGYAGPVSRYTTPMDKKNTVILGIEMEFEGDFYGWKELQDAHKGYLHYGYDSSVVGQNELSWDCGSYSWWKYIAPLKDVCEVVKKYGGSSGDSAGIHIHASMNDVNDIRSLASHINERCQTGKWNALMKAISMRNNLEKLIRYANLSEPATSHHAGISYNPHRTVEFRIFNSSLEYPDILRMIKFVKETFEHFAVVSRADKQIYSPETIKYIKRCADTQLEKCFITDEEYETIQKEFLQCA